MRETLMARGEKFCNKSNLLENSFDVIAWDFPQSTLTQKNKKGEGREFSAITLSSHSHKLHSISHITYSDSAT